jgi:HCOMODA/2-hydroxy-3-carboxy-muconic semialdehyde decarboxylase
VPAPRDVDPAVLDQLATANHILAHEGILDAFGHISLRDPTNPGQYLIARSLGPELVTPEDLQRFTLDGRQVDGDTRAPYAERAIHGAVYEARPDVMSVCHNHAPSLIPFGVTDTQLRPIFHMAALLGPRVPVWDIADDFGDTNMLVRTQEQGRSLARTLGSERVSLMRGHGAVVAGRSVPQTVMAAIYAELNARLLLQCSTLGQVRTLSDAEIEQAGQMLSEPLAAERAWTTWAARVK